MARPQQLVSQWQSRLATAERLAAGSLRLRWLHLVQARLYRFLLSCYGSGQWRTGVSDEQPRLLVVDELTEFSSTTGKPPKGAGKIQAVLKSVQNAQDHPPQMGPWTDGIGPDTHMAVTDPGEAVDLDRFRLLLWDKGLSARKALRGGRQVVEVPYCELQSAELLLHIHRGRLLRDQVPDRRNWKDSEPSARDILNLYACSMLVLVGVAIAVTGIALAKEGAGVGALIGLLMTAVMAVIQGTLLFSIVFVKWGRMSVRSRQRIVVIAYCVLIALPLALAISAKLVDVWNADAIRRLLLGTPTAAIAVTGLLTALVMLFADRFFRSLGN
jgi:hypothetical protein